MQLVGACCKMSVYDKKLMDAGLSKERHRIRDGKYFITVNGKMVESKNYYSNNKEKEN